MVRQCSIPPKASSCAGATKCFHPCLNVGIVRGDCILGMVLRIQPLNGRWLEQVAHAKSLMGPCAASRRPFENPAPWSLKISRRWWQVTIGRTAWISSKWSPPSRQSKGVHPETIRNGPGCIGPGIEFGAAHCCFTYCNTGAACFHFTILSGHRQCESTYWMHMVTATSQSASTVQRNPVATEALQ